MSHPGRSRRLPVPHRRVARGFVMLEALVALLVFSFGVLALVGLQSSMTRAQSTSKYRADAAYLATEATGLMWADVGTNLGTLSNYTTANCASYIPCNAWKTKVAAELPAGTVAVTVDTSTGDVTIAVGWTEPGGEAHQYLAATTLVPSYHS